MPPVIPHAAGKDCGNLHVAVSLYPIYCRFILQCPGLLSPTLLLSFLLNLLLVFVGILDLPKVCQGSLWLVLASILQLWPILSLSMV